MLGKRLNALRKTKGFTAQNMADKLGIMERSYRFYESGKRYPPLTTLVAIADILEVSVDYLLERDDFLKSLGVSFDEH